MPAIPPFPRSGRPDWASEYAGSLVPGDVPVPLVAPLREKVNSKGQRFFVCPCGERGGLSDWRRLACIAGPHCWRRVRFQCRQLLRRIPCRLWSKSSG